MRTLVSVVIQLDDETGCLGVVSDRHGVDSVAVNNDQQIADAIERALMKEIVRPGEVQSVLRRSELLRGANRRRVRNV